MVEHARNAAARRKALCFVYIIKIMTLKFCASRVRWPRILLVIAAIPDRFGFPGSSHGCGVKVRLSSSCETYETDFGNQLLAQHRLPTLKLANCAQLSTLFAVWRRIRITLSPSVILFIFHNLKNKQIAYPAHDELHAGLGARSLQQFADLTAAPRHEESRQSTRPRVS
jgi:hypothetical protein